MKASLWYIPEPPKRRESKGKGGWQNAFMDVYVEMSDTLEDWLKHDFRHYFHKWNTNAFDVVMVEEDPDDVTFGYIATTKIVLPFIAKFISVTDKGSHYRLFCLNEVKLSIFDPDTYDYEAEIEKIAEQGKW